MYGPFTPRLSGDEARYASESEAQNILRRARGGQVHSDHRLHLDDAGRDLDEAQAQSVELSASNASASTCEGPTSTSTLRRVGTAEADWPSPSCRRCDPPPGGSSR